MVQTMKILFQTERMNGRAFTNADWPMIHAMQTDAEAGFWLRGPDIEASKERSRTITARLTAQWEEGWGPFVLSHHGETIGYCGLRRSRLERDDEIEALWGILTPFRRRGFAGEAMREILNVHLPPGITSIASWTLADNLPSRRLMERLGFRFDGDALHSGLAHVVYRRGL